MTWENTEQIQNDIESYMNVESIKSVTWESKGYEYCLFRKTIEVSQ